MKLYLIACISLLLIHNTPMYTMDETLCPCKEDVCNIVCNESCQYLCLMAFIFGITYTSIKQSTEQGSCHNQCRLPIKIPTSTTNIPQCPTGMSQLSRQQQIGNAKTFNKMLSAIYPNEKSKNITTK